MTSMLGVKLAINPYTAPIKQPTIEIVKPGYPLDMIFNHAVPYPVLTDMIVNINIDNPDNMPAAKLNLFGCSIGSSQCELLITTVHLV
jgi:hypothetical protein